MSATDELGFRSPLVDSLHHAVPMIPVWKHFPLARRILNRLPPKFVKWLNPHIKGLYDMYTVHSLLALLSMLSNELLVFIDPRRRDFGRQG